MLYLLYFKCDESWLAFRHFSFYWTEQMVKKYIRKGKYEINKYLYIFLNIIWNKQVRNEKKINF